MLKYDSDLFRSSVKLADSIVNTEDDLYDIADIMYLSTSGGPGKEEFAQTMADEILASPDKWLFQLTHNELTLLQKLVEAGPDTYVETENMLMGNSLEAFLLVLSDREKNIGKVRYMICDELREAIAPYLENYQISKEQRVRFMVEQYACGILNLHGYLLYDEFMELLSGCLHKTLTRRELIKALDNSLLIRRLLFPLEDDYDFSSYIQSSYLYDLEGVQQKNAEHPEVIIRKRFLRGEVFLAGAMPVPQIPNPKRNELKLFMTQKLGHTEELADFNLQYLWFALQSDSNIMPIVTSIIDGKLSSMQELQEAIELFMDYCYLCPRWFLNGYSPKEALALEENGFERAFRKKAGRNDPCPCGSGKKYKKCCGIDN